MSVAPLADLHWLRHAVAGATDNSLERIVRMLDRIPQRGETDRVLELARARLRRLRPPRPLGFARLLFLPLDGAIVPASAWKAQQARVPRTAIPTIAQATLLALGEEGAAIAAACEGRTTAEHAVVGDLGAHLWPAAAAALPAAPPAGWAATGLTAEAWTPIAGLCRPIFAAGCGIYAAMLAAPAGPPDDLVVAALLPLVDAGPSVLAAALAGLMLHATAPGRVAAVAARLRPQLRPIALAVIDQLLETPAPAIAEMDVAQAAMAAAHLLRRLDDLEASGLLEGARQKELKALRHAADRACRERFRSAAEAEIAGPIRDLATRDAIPDSDVEAVERAARDLRMLGGIGVRFGGATDYERGTRALAEGVAAAAAGLAHPDGLTPIDIARVIEILTGAEAAELVLPA